MLGAVPKIRVAEAALEFPLNHSLTKRLECRRTEIRDAGHAVEVLQQTRGALDVHKLARGLAAHYVVPRGVFKMRREQVAGAYVRAFE